MARMTNSRLRSVLCQDRRSRMSARPSCRGYCSPPGSTVGPKATLIEASITSSPFIVVRLSVFGLAATARTTAKPIPITYRVVRRMERLLPGRVIDPADAAGPARRIGLTLAFPEAKWRTICPRSIRPPEYPVRGRGRLAEARR